VNQSCRRCDDHHGSGAFELLQLYARRSANGPGRAAALYADDYREAPARRRSQGRNQYSAYGGARRTGYDRDRHVSGGLQRRTTPAISLAYTPVNKAGDTMTGALASTYSGTDTFAGPIEPTAVIPASSPVFDVRAYGAKVDGSNGRHRGAQRRSLGGDGGGRRNGLYSARRGLLTVTSQISWPSNVNPSLRRGRFWNSNGQQQYPEFNPLPGRGFQRRYLRLLTQRRIIDYRGGESRLC